MIHFHINLSTLKFYCTVLTIFIVLVDLTLIRFWIIDLRLVVSNLGSVFWVSC